MVPAIFLAQDGDGGTIGGAGHLFIGGSRPGADIQAALRAHDGAPLAVGGGGGGFRIAVDGALGGKPAAGSGNGYPVKLHFCRSADPGMERLGAAGSYALLLLGLSADEPALGPSLEHGPCCSAAVFQNTVASVAWLDRKSVV